MNIYDGIILAVLVAAIVLVVKGLRTHKHVGCAGCSGKACKNCQGKE